jgi:indole-3-glycerol phosphate synthase/phosphoribosylanthranilate isomerase
MNPVQQLLRQKREDVERRKRSPQLQEMYSAKGHENRLVQWNKDCFHLIAEVKRASLSAGPIRPNIDVTALAAAYERAGASSISVLTEGNFFHGSLEDLRNIRNAVGIPILQKDFIVDEFQIREAKFYGASIVLLIARFLTSQQLQSFLEYCRELKINALVEITDEKDLEKISGPVEFLGVNSRDLETLQVERTRFRNLRSLLPDSFLIAESGINDLEVLSEIIDLGYHGALIGEHFLRAEDPAAEVSRFVSFAGSKYSVPLPNKPRIKICGITSEQDAMLAIEMGADALGFIFAESPRRMDSAKLRQFRSRIPKNVLCVGVFREQKKDEVLKIVNQLQLDVAQVYEPMQLPIPIWNARIAKQRSDIDSTRANSMIHSILWDLKADEDHLSDLWQEIAREKVFALAGGLTAENVVPAISICHPLWVDVARGVESSPGVKDKSKMHRFLSVARSGQTSRRS